MEVLNLFIYKLIMNFSSLQKRKCVTLFVSVLTGRILYFNKKYVFPSSFIKKLNILSILLKGPFLGPFLCAKESSFKMQKVVCLIEG